ncbi:uncharacterized protein F4807DRAFT_222656 [Annulohypoxylon truncatum]|uniref:uncharacterized protein n=1 Tax=Annulohypoxylon truncatum TaxID=327061 RepID=UPI0020079BED|nr:uncharacterized protein F4807DRAFT_222656 [Annulohypoxylon truncatum]KAI1206758.1 hypothetical protein F4807DRAFT_222656 [Annulohypoxylon truncatum]
MGRKEARRVRQAGRQAGERARGKKRGEGAYGFEGCDFLVGPGSSHIPLLSCRFLPPAPHLYSLLPVLFWLMEKRKSTESTAFRGVQNAIWMCSKEKEGRGGGTNLLSFPCYIFFLSVSVSHTRCYYVAYYCYCYFYFSLSFPKCKTTSTRCSYLTTYLLSLRPNV